MDLRAVRFKVFRSLFTMTLLTGASIQAHAIEVVVGAGGDLSFSDNHIRRSNTPPDVSPNTVWDQSGEEPFASLTRNIQDLFWGSDINFLNIETVLATSKQGLRSPKSRGYAFVSHPNGIRHLIESMNVNLLGLANNHAFDFGTEGLRRTKENIEQIEREYSFVKSHGIQVRGEKIAPVEFMVADHKVAFASINGAGGNGDGGALSLINVHSDDYRTLIQAFKRSDADLKILSIHYGTETQVVLNKGQADRYRYAVDHGGVNLILGHHPHVIRPIEVYKGAVIYYSLGNFLITGAANIDNRTVKGTNRLDHYRNYGLFAKTYFELSKGRADLTAIQAVPLKGMHWRPYVPEAKVAATNMAYLNKLNSEFGSTGVRFFITNEGKGVYCSGLRGGPRTQRICN